MPRIQHKRGTSANLASVNPTPLAGELVWDSTENAIKIGDGATAWTSLAYVTATPRSHNHDDRYYTESEVDGLLGGKVDTSDARLTDARTPTAHKATHATGGSDALTPGDIGAAPAASPTFTGNATFEASSGVPVTITNTGTGNSFVVNDAAGDTSPFVINASGQVGIGRASPNAGSGVHVEIAGDKAAVLERSTFGSVGVQYRAQGSLLGAMYGLAGGGLQAFTASSGVAAEAFRITSAGWLLLGTTSPSSLLTVNGVITVAATSGSAGSYVPSVTFSGDANTGFGQVSGQSDSASVFTAGHERVRVDANGRFIINDVSATHFLHIKATNGLAAQFRTGDATAANNAGVAVALANSGNANLRKSTIQIDPNIEDGSSTTSTHVSMTGGGAFEVDNKHTSGTVIFKTAGTERVRVKSNGAVRFVPLSADPASGEAGDVYYNSSTNKLRVYNGTSWVDLH